MLSDDFDIELEEESLGDIVISLEKAFEQSKEYNHSFEREVCFLVCHSTFHLLGYDHDTEENTKQMREKEEHILNKLNITNSEIARKKTKTRQGIIQAFNAAIEGIIYTFKNERNMKIHYFLAVVVFTASLFLGLDRFEMILLVFAISLVVIAEMFNTAIEKTIDMITDEYHILAKIAKDVAAGGVLIAALNSAVVGYLLFYDKLTDLSNSVLNSIRQSQIHLTLICIILVLIAVVVVKAITATGTPLKGGMPSGHTALAFATATAITFLGEKVVASTLAYLMAVLVAQSRIEGNIHTFWETVAGGLLGTLITILVFQIQLLV